MTNPDYTHLSLVVDRSGSMSSVQDDAQGGINALLSEQFALPGRLTVTLTEFDSSIDTVRRMTDKPFDYHLAPRGGTALLDAVGDEVTRTGEDLSALPEHERPGRVLLVVVTDGGENSSREWTMTKVREALAHQRDVYGWDVQFIGADEAAWQGERLGVKTTRYRGNAAGTRKKYAMLAAAMSTYRGEPIGSELQMPDVIDDEE